MAGYNEDLYFDPGITIKEEPLVGDNSLNISASVPIPGRRHQELSDFQDLQFNLDYAQSPSYQDINITGQAQLAYEPILNNTMWGTRDGDAATKQESMNLDDYEIFDVDKSDLIHDPTLVEINANDDLLDLNFDDLLLPEETQNCNGLSMPPTTHPKYIPQFPNLSNNNFTSTNILASSCPSGGMGFYRDSMDFTVSDTFTQFGKVNYPVNQNQSSGLRSKLLPTNASTPPKKSTLHELLLRQESPVLGQSTPTSTSPTVIPSMASRMGKPFNSRLSSSAPTNSGLIDHIWQRREPRKHLLSTGSLAEAGSTSSLSTGGVLSPEAHDLSHDEQEYEEDSDHYEDFSSDDDSDDDDDHATRQSKKERYFWQYNVQAKGPKGQRLVMKTKMENPHVLNEITDPVFSTECAVRGIKHSGKARKGDGNDLTPNPRKLFTIGKELDKLGRVINDMTPVSELPFNVRPKSRKEKNKLASRACRLKKKAQHEANKIKLHGLETEHKRLMNGLIQVKKMLGAKIQTNSREAQEQLSMNIEKVSKAAAMADHLFKGSKIAGQTTEYVNKVLEKVKSGVPTGGLEDL